MSKTNMANSTQLFKDDEEEARSGSAPSDDELRHITGITPDEEKDIDRRELDRREKRGAGTESSTSGTMGQTGLARAEEAAAQFGFRAVDGVGGLGVVKMYLTRNRRKALIGGSITTGALGIFASIFFLLIPLKIEDVVTNVQNHYMATSENAIESETDKLFTEYITRHVIPGYRAGHCGSTVDMRCSAAHLVGQSPTTRLYRTWSQARLENTLATKYHIEFKYSATDNNWYMKAPGLDPNGDKIGPNGERLGGEFQKLDRATMRTAYRDSLQSETLWKRVYLRYKVGRLLEVKYGIRRCLIFCGVTDPLKNRIDLQKKAAKIYIANRVIMPRSDTLGAALLCIFDESCDPMKVSSNTSEPALAGSEQSDTEKEITANFEKLAAKFGVSDAKALMEAYTKITDKGLFNYLLTRMMTTLVKEETAKKATDAIPVVGWINLGDEIYRAIYEAGPKVQKLGYVTNAAADVQMFQAYRTYADEVHTGHITATELGSLVDSLGPAVKGSKDLVGGTAAAEETPLYSKLMGSGESTGSSDYICNDKGNVPKGKLVCPEEVLGQGSGALNTIHHFLDIPGVNILKVIDTIWHSTVGYLFKIANWIVGGVLNLVLIKPAQFAADKTCDVPIIKWNIYCKSRDEIKKFMPIVMGGMIAWLIPNPFSSNMSGGRTFDSIAAGADVVGSDSAHTILGGIKLTPKQTADIINEQQSEAQAQFDRQPLFARMFSTDSPYSLVSRLAVAVPFGFQHSLMASFASFISNPFSSLAHGFSSIFTPRAVAATPDEDPFGVVQYGYPEGTVPDHPEQYWNDNCSDNPSTAYRKDNSWNQSAADHPDPDSGMPVNLPTSQGGAGVNPCLLIMATTGSLGAVMDSSNLTQDDLTDVNGSSSNPSTTASANVDTAHLYDDSTTIACASGTDDIGNYTGYHEGQQVPIKLCSVPTVRCSNEECNGGYGVNGKGYIVVNSRVSGAWLALSQAAKQDNVTLTSDSSYRTMAHQQKLCDQNAACSSGDYTMVAKPGTSNHQMGLAIDFTVSYGSSALSSGDSIFDWLTKNAASFGMKNYPPEPWHWSPTGN